MTSTPTAPAIAAPKAEIDIEGQVAISEQSMQKGSSHFARGVCQAEIAAGGTLLEEDLRRALIISNGDMMIFVERPVSVLLLVVAMIVLAFALIPSIAKNRDEVFAEP